MSPIAKFHSYVIAITVAVMFIAMKSISHLEAGNGAFGLVAGVIVAALSSLGIYRLIAALLLALLPKWRWLFKNTLGPYYLQGTWGGYVLTKTGKPRLIVEKYEQALDQVTVRGWSFKSDGSIDANWSTESAQVAPVKGELFCFYTVNVPYKDKLVEALGRMQFDRSDKSGGPRQMTGYTVDTDATQKLRYDDIVKLSDELLDLEIAKQETFKRFSARLEKQDDDAADPATE